MCANEWGCGCVVFCTHMGGCKKFIDGGLCWGTEFSMERTGTTTTVLIIPGSNSLHPKPREILSPAYTDLILGVNSLLVPAWHSYHGVMQKGEFLQELRQNRWQAWSIGAETLKVHLSSLVASTNEGAAG